MQALAEAVATWVRSGAVFAGRVRLFLGEPERADAWRVDLLAQDRDEPTLVVPLADVWAGRSPFSPLAVEDILTSLGRMERLAPELAPVLDDAAPSDLTLDAAAVLGLLRERAGPLDDAGIAVLIPSRWTHRPRLGLRAKAKKTSSSTGAGTGARLGLDTIVELGSQRLTKSDLAALARAVEAKRSLVRLQGQWVEIGPDTVGTLLDSIGKTAEAAAGDLVRVAMGLGDLGTAEEIEVVDIDASAVPWLSSLLDDALHATVEPVPTPPGFDGQLRPYQERGTGWLTFLGRLGLGACLADDMGLGKTAQLIATLLADPVDGPTPRGIARFGARQLESGSWPGSADRAVDRRAARPRRPPSRR